MSQDRLKTAPVEVRDSQRIVVLIQDLKERLLCFDSLFEDFDKIELLAALDKIALRVSEALNGVDAGEENNEADVINNPFDLTEDDQPDQTGKHPLWSTDAYVAAQENVLDVDPEIITSEFSTVPETGLQRGGFDVTQDWPVVPSEITEKNKALFIEEGPIRCTLDLEFLNEANLSCAVLIHMREDFNLADYLGESAVLARYALDLTKNCLKDAVGYLPSIVDGYVSFNTCESCMSSRCVKEDYLKLMFLPDKFISVSPFDLAKEVLDHGENMLTFEELSGIHLKFPELLKDMGVKDGVPVWVRTALMDKYGITFFGLTFFDGEIKVVLSTIPMMKEVSSLANGY